MVSASVHRGDVVSGIVFRARLAGVGQSSLFFYGERVELGPQHHRRTGAILQDSDNARAANMFGHVVPETLQPASQLRGGFRLIRRHRRILREVAVEALCIWTDATVLLQWSSG